MKANQFYAKLLTPGLKKFRNRHKGESCYIFGDGPSIKWFDLASFNDHPAICCGMMPFHRDFGKLNVKYVMLVAPWLFVPKILQAALYRDLRLICAEYKLRMKGMLDKDFFIHVYNRPWLSGHNINYVHRWFPDRCSSTDNLLQSFNLFSGSFHATLSLAYYLGFAKVYLVGFDGWTLKPARMSRWYEHGEGELYHATNFAKDFLAVLENEIDICAITVTGETSGIKGVLYSEHTGNQAIYNENHQLMDQRTLDIMRSSPRNNIDNRPNGKASMFRSV